MNAKRWTLGVLALLLIVPMALAQETQPTPDDANEDGTTVPGTDNDNTDNVDVDIGDNGGDDPDEATGFGMSTTMVVVLVVLAVLVVALIVAMANRP